MINNVTIKINNVPIVLPNNTTILQACELLNIKIPKFCFHENLQIAGNCRMCLVEIKNQIKPVVACATPITNKMEIFTNTPLVQKARENILEFLLINHPLDCPICDQGGECDLQEHTMNYGIDKSRFFFHKRAVSDKNVGPFIKTIMTRCIHCTRCVRFATEVCGIDNLGTTGRGNKTEISFYIPKIFESEFSGNVIDLCPVGALTSKTYAFKARPWELKKSETIDLLENIGSSIIIQTFNNEIIRVIPKKNNSDFNFEWISDKTRYFFDSNIYQRIDEPLIRDKISHKLEKASWSLIFSELSLKLQQTEKKNIKMLIGSFADIKSLFWLKKICYGLGISNVNLIEEDSFINQTSIFINSPELKKNLIKIKKCLLINCDPRTESPLFNLHIRNMVNNHNLQVYSIGESLNLTYPVKNLGITNVIFNQIYSGKHELCKEFVLKNDWVIYIGSKSQFVVNLLLKLNILKKKKDFIFVLQDNTSFYNFFEVFGISKIFKQKDVKTLLLWNTNDENLNQYKKRKDVFTIYIGHHFTKNAEQADLILPCTTFLEKSLLHINQFNVINKTTSIIKQKDQVKTDYSILKGLFLFFEKQNQIKKFQEIVMHLKIYNYLYIFPNLFDFNFKLKQKDKIKKMIKCNYIFKTKYVNHFTSKNIFEKYSKNLTKSIEYFQKNTTNFN